MRRSIAAVLAAASCATAVPTFLDALQPRQANSGISPSAFRRRAYQNTAVLNNWAYIDGGEFSYETGTQITYQYSSTLIAIDLSKDWVNRSVTLNSISKPSGAPDLVDGGIWVDHNAGVLYTGFAGRQSTYGDDAEQPNGLWSFKPDGSGSGTWTNLNSSTDQGFQTDVRPFSPLVAAGGGAGYMLGGFAVNSSSSDPRLNSWHVSGLVTYNYTTQKLSNNTVSDGYTGGVDQMGGMVYVPNFGDQGVLVVLGGDQVGKNEPGFDALLNFSSIAVYDVASGSWYDQATSGNIPEDRKEFCTAGVASTNQTYEILIYAGWNGNLGSSSVPYDEAYVLSLPAFQWFKASYPAANPRHGVTCVPVGGGQILTVGGVDTTQNGPDNLYDDVFNTADPFEQGLAIFDLNKMAFAPSFAANPPAYTGASVVRSYYSSRYISPDFTCIYKLIMSSSRTPSWSNPSLSAVFAVSSFPTAASSSAPTGTGTGTSNNKSSSSDAGPIAGGVVGGVVGLALIAGIAFFFMRRARKNRTGGVGGYPKGGPAPAVEADGMEGQRHEMPYNPSGEGALKYGGPPAHGYQPYRQLAKFVNQPPSELPGAEQEPLRHELA